MLFVTATASVADAQDPTPTPAVAGTVSLGQIKAEELAPGSASRASMPVRVAEGHRVQANPASSEFLVPLEVVIEDQRGLEFGAPVYPKADLYLLEGSDEPLLTYVGEFEVVVPVTAAADADPGEREVTGELRYQACNSRMCLFPSSLPINFKIVVSASDSGSKTTR